MAGDNGRDKKGKKGSKKEEKPKYPDAVRKMLNKRISRAAKDKGGYEGGTEVEKNQILKGERVRVYAEYAAAPGAAASPTVAVGVVAGVGGGVASGLAPAPIPPHQLGGGGEEDAAWDLLDDDDEYLVARLSELQERGDVAAAGDVLEALVATYPAGVQFDIIADITHRILSHRRRLS
ncbi:hypothetical protein BDZ45DRAFT_797319 [Acephala macrosclerotiorum]|nr:hypothetical protein BDZ45DRAFT_797319 [Acephala macrosclerotiorum]